MNHDKGICHGGEDVDLLLEVEGKDQKNATEAVEGHEGDGDARTAPCL
jgi:hypothetical protein